MPAVHFSHVSFSYSTAAPILEDASFGLGPGWTSVVGANGAGKTTLLSLITGDHRPDSGTVTVEPIGLSPVLCEQRVDELTSHIAAFAHDWDRDAVRMRAGLDLDPAHLDRWDTLSPGERKRWQIGTALVHRPDVLLLDEPTNHLDADARKLLEAALARFRGCGLVVSHDRTLLNDLTTVTLRIVGGRVEHWNGGYDDARRGWLARDAEEAVRYDKMRSEQRKLARRIADQRRKSQQKDAERIRERRVAGKHDLDTRGSAASYKHERGQKTGAQTVSSMTNALDKVTDNLASHRLDKDLGGAITFPVERADKKFLIRFTGPVTAGRRALFSADVAVRRADRIRVSGRNGAGKSTLLSTLIKGARIPTDRILVLPQESTSTDGARVLETIRGLQPDLRGRVMSIVALLGADPAAVLASDLPSPGETRKLTLALGLGTPTWLLALDEPTNHLDLPSIERLQDALTHYRGAVLMITHDDSLADAVTTEVWDVSTWR